MTQGTQPDADTLNLSNLNTSRLEMNGNLLSVGGDYIEAPMHMNNS